MPAELRRSLLAWYAGAKRDLPWRRTRDPYPIWISEIMLQQTRVAAVIPYYAKFLERFPTVEVLAAAADPELLSAWAGLGYYTRARNLRKAAQQIAAAGGFPESYAGIRALSGIGDYTAAAIASIAFGLRHAVLDGNVIRVLARLTAERGNVAAPETRRRLQFEATRLLPKSNPADWNQAVMELGATVCLPRNPQCLLCPVERWCQARRQGIQGQLPVKQPKKTADAVEQQLVVIEKQGRILLWQRPPESRRLAGFWEFPEPDRIEKAKLLQRIGEFQHTIVNTKYRVSVWSASIELKPRSCCWVHRSQLHEIPLSTTARKTLQCLEKQPELNNHL